MSRDISVNIQRAGANTSVYTDVSIQMDTMSQIEAAYYGGAGPYRRFYGYILANLDIRHGDLLIDVKNIDPDTQAFAKYRVISNPNDDDFPDSHMELVLDRMRGT